MLEIFHVDEFDKIAHLQIDTPEPEQPLHILCANCLLKKDQGAWEALIRRLQPLFARTIYRVAAGTSVARPDEVDDLIQESFLKLGTALQGSLQHAAFENEGAAVAYFKALAANTARDYFRSRNTEKRGLAQTSSLDELIREVASSDAPDLERQLLIKQIDGALAGDSQARTVFWLYYKQGFTAKEIAAIAAFKLTAKGVESLIRRLTITIRQKINPAEAEGESPREAFF